VRITRYKADGHAVTGLMLGDGDGVAPLPDWSIGDVVADPVGAQLATSAERLPLDDVTFAAPIDPTSRVFAVAQNFPSHAMEISGTDAPPQPVLFLKTVESLVGPEEPLELPPITQFLDYEAEVAVVIGGHGVRVSPLHALGLVGGVTCFNDGTGRDLQATTLGGKELIDWFSAKTLDRSGAIGPWIVPIGELRASVEDVRVRCRINGEAVQDDRTSNLVASVAQLISFVSHRVALRPGDVIATGTPGGVGKARGVNLKDGDEVEVEGVGVLRNRVASGSADTNGSRPT
jgi:2-keto-4-pentenoate hydratase/2-oxohepta-3-ene-1,7-dioic acid hydratase in catechol pathway